MKKLIIISAIFLSSCSQLGIESETQAETQASSIQSLHNACQYTEGKSDNELLLFGKVAQPDGGLQEQGVYIRDRIIVAIDKFDVMRSQYPNAGVFECHDAFFSPGFINAHEHTSFSYQAPDSKMEPVYQHRQEWQDSELGKYKIIYANSTSQKPILAWIELRHLLSGETVISGSGSIEGLIKNVTGSNDSTFSADLATFPYKRDMYGKFKSYCITAVLPSPLELEVNQSISSDVAYVPHVAEGTNCVANGELQGYFSYVQQQRNNSNRRKYSMIHALPVSKANIQDLKDMNVSIIWSPRSNVALYGQSLDPIPLIDDGASVALGTDWSPSGSFNMLEEMRCAQTYTQARSSRMVTGAELWRMATIEAARSLGIDNKTGSIEVGKAADIVVISDANNEGVSGVANKQLADIWGVMVDGRLLSVESEKVTGSYVDNMCLYAIGSKKICEDIPKVSGVSFEQLLEMNKENVDLFSTDDQAKCKVD